MTKDLISIIVPMRNEEANISRLFAALDESLAPMKKTYNFELVVTDNASEDGTWQKIMSESISIPIRAFRFNRNVGVQKSILYGLKAAKGRAVIQVDADLQDPPEMLRVFLAKWEEGYLDVYGIRIKRAENLFMNKFRSLGYAVVDLISDTKMPKDVGDFRLLDRQILESLFTMKSHEPYLRGMIASLGFKSVGIPYERSPRIGGKSNIGFARLVRMGLSAIFNHSTVPLRFASIMGILFLFFSALGGLALIALKMFDSSVPAGYTSTNLLILFSLGLNAFFLGILGEYLLRIYKIIKVDPQPIAGETWSGK